MRFPKISIDVPAAGLALILVVSGGGALVKGGEAGFLVVWLGSVSFYLLFANQSAQGHRAQLVRGYMMAAVACSIGIASAASLLAGPATASVILHLCLFVNGVATGHVIYGLWREWRTPVVVAASAPGNPTSPYTSRFDAQHGPDRFGAGHGAEHRSVPHE